MKYLFCIDIDGTLVDSKSELSKNTIEYIKNLSTNNIVTLVTGRGYESAVNIYNQLELNTLLATNGGAVIFEGNSTTKKVNNKLSNKVIKEFKEKFAANISASMYESEINKYRDSNASFFASWEHSKNSIICDLNTVNEDLYCAFFIMDFEHVKEYSTYFENTNYDVRTWGKPNSSNKILVEVCSTVFHKGSALNFIKNYYKNNYDKTVAIGDNDNDIDMFKVADIAAVMNNAKDDVKKYATFVTKNSNDDDGVITFIKELLNQ